jgi:type II secretion system protein J
LRAGFTLLELLVAIALLGVLAVLCWRGLESVLSSRDRLTRESDGLRALTIAFAQVDDDLRRTWAVRTIPAVARAVRFLSVDDRLVLELARLGGAASDPTRIDRVVWRLRANTLERGVAEGWERAYQVFCQARFEEFAGEVAKVESEDTRLSETIQLYRDVASKYSKTSPPQGWSGELDFEHK